MNSDSWLFSLLLGCGFFWKIASFPIIFYTTLLMMNWYLKLKILKLVIFYCYKSYTKFLTISFVFQKITLVIITTKINTERVIKLTFKGVEEKVPSSSKMSLDIDMFTTNIRKHKFIICKELSLKHVLNHCSHRKTFE